MKLVLNNIDDISLSNISINKNRIFYRIGDIKLNGLFFSFPKNMIENENKYMILFGQCQRMRQLNEYFKQNHKYFLKDNGSLYIEVIQNKDTNQIFSDNKSKLCIYFKSINDNNYPKIHILPWIIPN